MEEQTPLPEDFPVRSAVALRELEQRAQAALMASQEQASHLEAEITRQLEHIASTLLEHSATEAAEADAVSRVNIEFLRLQSEYDETRTAWTAERVALETARDEWANKTAQLDAAHRLAEEEWQNQLRELEEKLEATQATGDKQSEAWKADRANLLQEREELQQKFDLALEDTQRLRSRVAELEQELSRRPETVDADSAELVALRSECDKLKTRINELERQPTVQAESANEQQMADLQRRFEMAVEDVRELKTKNAKLEAELAAATKLPSSSSDEGKMDWESQKRRLLASLEDESVELSNGLSDEDRVAIENTIEMTDAIVAQKDKEIAELRAMLTCSAAAPVDEADKTPKNDYSELIDGDEVIAEHRKRIAELEQEMENKLRTAELELSIERAKLARQNAKLEELRIDLEKREEAFGPSSGAAAGGEPRRRWLSKLGLSGDDQK